MEKLDKKTIEDRIKYLDKYVNKYLLRKDTIRKSKHYNTFITRLFDKLCVNKIDEDNELDVNIMGTMYLFIICNTDKDLYDDSIIKLYEEMYNDLVLSGFVNDEAKAIICNQFASTYCTQKKISPHVVNGVSHIFIGIVMKYFAPTFD